MNLLKSLLRHLLGAALSALGAVLVTPADLTWKVVAVAVGAGCVPVLVKYLDPTETDYGRTADGDGGWTTTEVCLAVLAACAVLLVLRAFGVIH